MREREVEDFVRENAAHLLQLAFLLTCDNDHAEDLVQEVILGELRNWEPADTPERRQSHVRSMLIRTHLSTRQPLAIRSGAPLDHEVVAIGAAPGVDRADAHDAFLETSQQLQELSAEQRAVLVLKYYENLDDEDVAVLLESTPGRVHVITDRAFMSLKG